MCHPPHPILSLGVFLFDFCGENTQNRALALQILSSKLRDLERNKMDSERRESRNTQIGTGQRGEKIRTYHFPQSRVTDHRSGVTVHDLERVMDGEVEEVMEGARRAVEIEEILGKVGGD